MPSRDVEALAAHADQASTVYAYLSGQGIFRSQDGGADWRLMVVAVFLGYTHCPDVCLTTMAKLKLATQQLSKEVDQIQVLFVTVDPERDTPQALADWVTAFDPHFLGLRGTPDELKTLASQLKVYYGRAGQAGDDSIMHSSNVFLFDRHGAIRVLEDPDADAGTLAHDIRQLLQEDRFRFI